VELVEVPYFAQQSYQCGPAALAMALQAAGVAATPEQLAPQVYLPGRRGSLQVELQAATRRHGLLAYPLAPRLDALLDEVAAGQPVIVLQNLGFDWYPVWHYAVVIGYDLDRRELILRSGPERRQRLPLTTFERTWRRADHWALLALSPARLPAGADPDRYLQAALALEQTGPAGAAAVAYQTALRRWPTALTALIGAGNTAFASGNLDAAEQAFRRATVAHPDAAPAFNNLAHVLAERGRLTEALAAARRAQQLGGVQREVYAATLAEIRRRAAAEASAIDHK
jgi:tetratricopeptide (TPR) repeat protein